MEFLAYAVDLIACKDIRIKTSVGKTEVMHVGKSKPEIVCTLNDEPKWTLSIEVPGKR